MESIQDTETINQAIQKLTEEKRIKDTSSDVKLSQDDDDDGQVLSRLLSQLESLKGVERSTVPKEETSPSIDKSDPKIKNDNQERGGGNVGVEEEIVKELKAVKRQNTITHCLLSALIVVTLIWELSEVSLVLKLRDGMSHPFRSFGSLLAGMLPSPGKINVVGSGDDDKDGNDHNIVDPLLPSVRMPELPHVEFPHMGSNDEE
ncbi:hypothetical protein CXB51_003660 [Gossypium anomalum]|uniref:Uncharacterized protein n=1 Tax=Gossypium anomalum TaxID=47600 RepID=A0A8J6D9I8_9ROSI|nr:hypothetical protein CXB51_003660 [Gossypium anomalum]